MKFALLLIITVLTFSCAQREKKENFTLDGEWRIDSIAGQKEFYNREFVFFIKDSAWLIRLDSCPVLIGKNLVLRNDSVFKNQKLIYSISRIDSTSLWLNSTEGKALYLVNIARRLNHNYDYSAELTDIKKKDSLCQRVVGWWQLTEPLSQQIKLINNSKRISDFKLFLNKNGQASFYSCNNPDSVEWYGWTANVDGLSFSRGCIAGSDSKIFTLDSVNMTFMMDNHSFDTLKLQRINALNAK